MGNKNNDKTDCLLCKLPDNEQFVIRAEILTGKSTCADIARKYQHLEITAEDVRVHVHYHTIDPKSTDGIGINHVYEKTSNVINTIEKYFNQIILKSPEASDSSVRQMVTLSKELRESLKLVMELEDKYGNKRKKERADKLEEKYKRLTAILMETTCDACKEKIFERLKLENLL